MSETHLSGRDWKGEWRMKLPPFLPNQSELQKIQINESIIRYFCLLKGNGNFHQMRQSYEILFYVFELMVGWMFIVVLPP